MEFVLSALTFLVLLACPLMMVFCVAGIRKAGCNPSSENAPDTSGLPWEARVAAFEGRLATIQAELQAIRTEDEKIQPASALDMDRSEPDRQPEVDRAAPQTV
jgi:hypothetical protein